LVGLAARVFPPGGRADAHVAAARLSALGLPAAADIALVAGWRDELKANRLKKRDSLRVEIVLAL